MDKQLTATQIDELQFKVGDPKKLAKLDLEENIAKVQEENAQLKQIKTLLERQNTNLQNENYILISKLNNLENVFVGSNIVKNRDGSVFNNIHGDYNLSAVRNP